MIGGSVVQTNLGLRLIEIEGRSKVENDTRINRIDKVESIGLKEL